MSKDSESDSNFSKEIDRVFATNNDLDKIESGVINAVKKRSQSILAKDPSAAREIERDVKGYSREIIRDQKLNVKPEVKNPGKENQLKVITPESKKNYKKLLKNFAIYEVYKVMNPRRIAGETDKTNYQHNLVVGGEKRAESYAKRNFSEQEKDEMKRAVRAEVDSWKEPPREHLQKSQSFSELASGIRGFLERPESSLSSSVKAMDQGEKLERQAKASRDPSKNNGRER